MSFLVGKTEQRSDVNGATSGLDSQLIKYIQGQGFAGLNPGTTVDAASIAPYQKLFADQNAQTFGQAKEAAGNLTGSGLSNALGTAAQRASTEQGSFLANLFEQRRQQDASRFLQLILGTLGSPAGGVHDVHQSGLLDSLTQGAAAAAPFLAGPAGPAVAAATPATAAAQSGGQLGQAAYYNFPNSVQPRRTTEGFGDWLGGFNSPVTKVPRDSFGVPER